jgi:hypothetical protein
LSAVGLLFLSPSFPCFFDPFFLLLALPFGFSSCLDLLLLLGFLGFFLFLSFAFGFGFAEARRKATGKRSAGSGGQEKGWHSARRMEIAAAARPDTATGRASLVLCALEDGEAVEALALEAIDLGPTAT